MGRLFSGVLPLEARVAAGVYAMSLLVFVAVACSPKEEEAVAETEDLAGVEVIDPGTGEPSVEPLWPMRVGVRYVFEGGGIWTVLRHSDRFGKVWLHEQDTFQPNPFATSFGYGQGRWDAYWSNEAEGLVLRAAGSQLALEEGILVLPAQVRAGMHWQSRGADGKVLLEGTVTGGKVRETQFGARRVWAVHFTTSVLGLWSHTDEPAIHAGVYSFLAGYAYYFDGSMWESIISGAKDWSATWDQEFIEGRGPADATLSIIPLADSEPVVPPRTPLPEAAFPRVETLATTLAFSAIESSVTWEFQVAMGGFCAGAIPDKHGISFVPNFRMCYRTDGSNLAPDEYETACQDAAGTVFSDDGYRLSAPMGIAGDATWVDPSGQSGVCVAQVSGVFSPTRGLIGAEFVRDLHAWSSGCPAGNGGWNVDLGRWGVTWGTERVRRIITVGPGQETGTGVVFHSAIPWNWNNLGWLGHAELGARSPDVSWAMRKPSLDQPDVDSVSTVLRADNTRETYQVSEDGLIWRLSLEDGVLYRRLLAAVELPVDHQAVGVVPIKPGVLQLWTQKGMEFSSSGVANFVGAIYTWLDQATHFVYDVPIDESAPSEPFPIVQGLHVAASGRDVRLCAPRGNVLPTTGWMLGGAPARGYPVDEGRCLLLVRQLLPGSSVGVSGADAWLVRGTLPEVGEVEIAFTPQVDEIIPGEMRPSPDGAVGRDSHADSKLALLDWATTDYYYFFPDRRTGGAWRINFVVGGEAGYRLMAEHHAWDTTAVTYHEIPYANDGEEVVPPIHYTADDLPAITHRGQELLLDLELGLVPAPPSTVPTDRIWLPAAGLGFMADAGLPIVWRSRGPAGDLLPVRLPDCPFMAGASGAVGACAADGACFLLVSGLLVTGRTAWTLLRVDAVDSGLHEVSGGTIDSLSVASRLFIDDEVVTVVGVPPEGTEEHVLFRISRDVEPDTCDNCSAEEECLGGFCPCSFGVITLDGLCLDGIPDVSYRTCADASSAGVLATEWVWIDADDEGPSPLVLTHCDDPDGWTPVPTGFDLLSARHYEGSECRHGLPGYEEDQFLGVTSTSALHGEFQVRFSFLTATNDPSMTRDSMAILAPIESLDASGVLPGICSLGSEAPPDAISFSYGFPGGGFLKVNEFGDALEMPAPAGAEFEVEVVRDEGGFIRLSVGGTEVWKSSVPHWAAYRLVMAGDRRMTINSMRWVGTPPDFCAPLCDGLNCGEDGCGGVCGLCGANATCDAGVCQCDATFVGDGLVCDADVGGSPELPALTCAEALAAKAPASTWYPFAWIDQDGPGPEPVFQQICEVESPSTKPAIGVLFGTTLAWDGAAESCQLWSELSPPVASPMCWTSGICGDSVPAGTSAAASYRLVRNQFEVSFQFSVGPGGQSAAISLDPLDSFDPVSLAWVGWHPECGQTVALASRVTVRRDASGIWVTGGSAPSELVLPAESGDGVFTLARASLAGPLQLKDSDGALLWQFEAPLADSLRVVGEVEGGGASNVNVVTMSWL